MTPLEYAETICYSSKETLHLSYNIAKMLKGQEGAFVECGVAAGAQVIAMAAADSQRDIFAFDSFQGIPLPSNRDDQMPGIRMLSKEEIENLPNPGQQYLITTGATSVSLDDFYTHIYNSGLTGHYICPVVGWFEDTTSEWNAGKILLLRLDGDLYNSTIVCLRNLFKHVPVGGFVIIDDYALKGCREACEDFFIEINYAPEYSFIEGKGYKVAYFQKK
jgi:O-methyltransferase